MQKGEELFKREDINQLRFSNSFEGGKSKKKHSIQYIYIILHHILY